MATTATLAYTLKLDAGGFVNPMRAAMGALRGMLSAGSQIGNISSGLLSAKGVLESIAGILSRPITLAADMEALNAEFEVMLGSAAKAKSLLKDLQAFANTTPYGTAGLAQAAKTLLAFGASGSEVVPILRTLGDVAGGSQEKLDSLVLAFSQISSAGKLQGGDLLQLINAGFNPLQEISRRTGRSMADLRKDMENGAISSRMVADAFRSATSAGGRFAGNTEKQGKVFKGLWSTMQDGADELARTLGAPLANSLKPVLVEGTRLLASMVPQAKALGDVLGRGITTAFAILKGGNALSTLGLGLKVAFQEAVNGVVATLHAGVKSLGPLLQTSLGIAIGFLSSTLPSIGSTLATGINAVIAGLVRGAQVFVEAFSDPHTVEGLQMALLAVISRLKAELQDVFASIAEQIPGRSAFGAELRAGAASTRRLSETQGNYAKLLFNESSSSLGQALGGVANAVPSNAFDFSNALKTLTTATQQAAREFSVAFSQAPRVFDTSADRSELSRSVAADLRKLTARPIPVQIINQNGRNAGNVGGVF